MAKTKTKAQEASLSCTDYSSYHGEATNHIVEPLALPSLLLMATQQEVLAALA